MAGPNTLPPVLVAGPTALLPFRFAQTATAGNILGIQNFGPYTPSNAPNTKVVIAIVQTAPDVPAPAAHLAAIVSLDNGATWKEIAGPAVYIGPGTNAENYIALSCYRLVDNVYTVNSLTAGNYSLLRFNLATLAWVTINAAISTYTLSGSLPDASAYLLGINQQGIGLVMLVLEPVLNVILPPSGQAQSAPRYMFFNTAGANLFEGTVLEPDTPYAPTAAADSDWTQLWPFFDGGGSDQQAGIFALDDDGNFWASAQQLSYDGTLQRQRTVMWPAVPTSITPTFSVSATAPIDFDATLPGAVVSNGVLQSVTEEYSAVLRPSDGTVATFSNPTVAGGDVVCIGKPIIWVPAGAPGQSFGRIALQIGISFTNFGNTATLLISDVSSLGGGQRGTALLTATSPSPIYDALSASLMSAELNGNNIDLVIAVRTDDFVFDNSRGFYYARILLGLPPLVPAGDGGRKTQILTPNQFDFCLHREYRLFCNIDYDAKGCAKLPKCFSVPENEWGEAG